jgi:hypothetical protein
MKVKDIENSGPEGTDEMFAELGLDGDQVLCAVVVKRGEVDGELGALVSMGISCHSLDELDLLAQSMARVAKDLADQVNKEKLKTLLGGLREVMDRLKEPDPGPVGYAEPPTDLFAGEEGQIR